MKDLAEAIIKVLLWAECDGDLDKLVINVNGERMTYWEYMEIEKPEEEVDGTIQEIPTC